MTNPAFGGAQAQADQSASQRRESDALQRTLMPLSVHSHAAERAPFIFSQLCLAYFGEVDATPGSHHLGLDSAAVVVVSRQGRIQYWSQGATALFGYEGAHMVGTKGHEIIPEEFRARHWAAWGRVWRANGFPQGTPVMIPVLCADETVRRFVSHLAPIHAPHGELLAVTAVWAPPSDRDIGVRELT